MEYIIIPIFNIRWFSTVVVNFSRAVSVSELVNVVSLNKSVVSYSNLCTHGHRAIFCISIYIWGGVRHLSSGAGDQALSSNMLGKKGLYHWATFALPPRMLLSLKILQGFHPPKLFLDLHSISLFPCTTCEFHTSPLACRFLKERDSFLLSLPAQHVAHSKC